MLWRLIFRERILPSKTGQLPCLNQEDEDDGCTLIVPESVVSFVTALDAKDGDGRPFDGDSTGSKSSSRSITLLALFFPVVVGGDPLALLLALPLDCHAIHLVLRGVFDGDPSCIAASVPCTEMKLNAWIKIAT
jgi:hypothetical protein